MRTSRTRMTGMAALAWGVIAFLLATDSSAQGRDQPATSAFRVIWHHSAERHDHAIAGSVSNGSNARVTDVQLRIEGLNNAGDPVGVSHAWAIGDILPAGETSFLADSIPGAVNYRITVESFDIISVTQSP